MNWKPYLTAFLLFCAASPSTTLAKVYQLTPQDDWFSVLNGDRLQPGDEVVLASGTYRDGRRLVMGHRGTAERPVTIRSVAHAKVILHRPDSRQNSINMVGAQHLILQGLEITGGSTGIRLMKSNEHPCRFVTIEGMHIHHVGGAAITANSTDNAYEGLVFRRNHIHHTSGHGEGFYLGANNNSDGTTSGYIFDSLIEGNYIHDLGGPDVSQGDGIEIKDGSFNNRIRDNVIHDTNYPGIIVYGTDGKAPNVVERNVIWNSGDHGIQAAANAIIRNNITFDNKGEGIYCRAHQGAKVGKLQILHNTVVARRSGGVGIRVAVTGQERLAGPVLIANNAIYVTKGGFALRLPNSEIASSLLSVAGNVGTGETDGLPGNVDHRKFNPTGRLELDLDEHYFPRHQSSLIGAANSNFTVLEDFADSPRKGSNDVGAYVFRSGAIPGTKISSDFKLPYRSGR